MVDEQGLDGLWCNQEDAAGLFKQVSFAALVYVPVPAVNWNLRVPT
jgi:hypothetical protein